MAVHRRKTAQAGPGSEGSQTPKEESVKGHARFVTEVVEVVEEPQKEEAIETIKKDAEEIRDVADQLETPLAPETSVTEQPRTETIEDEDVNNKGVVEELFQKGSSQVPSEITFDKEGSGKNMFVWALIVVIVALVVGGGLIFAVRGTKSMPSLFARPTPTPTPAPTPTPSPTPQAVEKATFAIQVLNGGGTPGAAAKIKSFLEEKGYKVGDVGNTDNYTYDKTEIHGKSAMQAALANLQADLNGTYAVGTVAADLSSDSSFDVQVIVGKE